MKYLAARYLISAALTKKINLFILFALFSISLSHAQESILAKKITFSADKTSIEQILKQLEKQYHVEFQYSSTALDLDKKVSVSFREQSLQKVVEELLGNAARGLSAQGNRIKIQPSRGKGQIKGEVKTSDGKAASFVNINISNQYRTQTDEFGFFQLNNVEAGEQELIASYVGLQSKTQQVAIKTNGTTSVRIILNEDANTLNEIIVNGKQGNQFATKNSVYVSKMPLSDLENPQVYNTINSSLMKEQLSTNLTQVLNNVTGAVASNTSRGENQLTLRGFTASVGARNGIQMMAGGRTGVDPVNIERIEVLKGPSATLFGNTVSSYGGAVNIITKKPFETAQSEIAYTVGSWGLNRITADVNSPLTSDGKVLFRLNAGMNKQNSFRETGHNNTYTIAPSILYRASDRLTISLDIEAYHENVIRASSYNIDALGINNVKQIPLGYRQTLFGEDFDANAGSFRTYFDAQYKLSDKWTSQTSISVNSEDLKMSYQNESTFINRDSIRRAMRVFGPINTTITNLQHNLRGDINLGQIRNRIVWGLDYTQESQDRYTARGTIDEISLLEPIYHVTRKMANDKIGQAYGYSTKVDRYATYASDLINFTDRLMLLASLRLDHYVRNTSDGGNDSYKQTSVTPKFGLIYQPWKETVSLFANYMSGFTNMGPVDQPDGTVLVLKPEFSTQWEGGVKLNSANDRYKATISYYNINVKDAVRADANYTYFQDGKQKSEGFDISVQAHPVDGLNIIGGYAYNKNRYTVFETGVEREVTGNPANVANVWLSYKFQPYSALENVGFGVGANYVDKSYFNQENTIIVPSYTLMNASVYYERQKWRFSIASNNLTNQKYWNYANSQPLRQWLLSTSFKF